MTLPSAALLGLALFALPLSPLRAQEPAPAPAVDSVRLGLARELLEVTEADQAFYRGVELTLPGQKAANPRIPEVFWTEFMQRIKDGLPGFTARVAPIYAARLTADDLRAIIAFYRTPAGQHFAREQVDLARGLMEEGQKWGAEVAAQVATDLAERGIFLQ